MSDMSLRQDVIDELEFEPSLDAANIGVAVKNGVVTDGLRQQLPGEGQSRGGRSGCQRRSRHCRGTRGAASGRQEDIG